MLCNLRCPLSPFLSFPNVFPILQLSSFCIVTSRPWLFFFFFFLFIWDFSFGNRNRLTSVWFGRLNFLPLVFHLSTSSLGLTKTLTYPYLWTGSWVFGKKKETHTRKTTDYWSSEKIQANKIDTKNFHNWRRKKKIFHCSRGFAVEMRLFQKAVRN